MTDVKPPVDPMSDLSWARVERGLWARLDGTTTAPAEPAPSIRASLARRRGWLWIAVPSLALAGAVAATFALMIDKPSLPAPAPQQPQVATPTPAQAIEQAPTRVVSGAAPSTISVGDAHVTLDPESALVMPGPSDATSTAVLERGAAWFAIAPRAGHQFVVIAGDTVVRVVGTKFRVARFEEKATVEVERGLVDVTFHGSTVKVAAGQTWSSEAPQAVGARVLEAPAPVAPTAEPPKRIATAVPAPVNEDERAKYERYAALEASDPDAAITGYLDIARGASRWAEISLYAAARLAADRGEPRAKTLLNLYLRRFPRGANADDARQLLDRLKGAP